MLRSALASRHLSSGAYLCQLNAQLIHVLVCAPPQEHYCGVQLELGLSPDPESGPLGPFVLALCSSQQTTLARM